MNSSSAQPDFRLTREQQTTRIELLGDWLIEHSVSNTQQTIDSLNTQFIELDASSLGKWDSRLITFLVKLRKHTDNNNLALNLVELPEGAQRLLNLAFAVEAPEGAKKLNNRENFFSRIGKKFLSTLASIKSIISFVGEITLSIGRFLRGKANYQRSDLWVTIQETGAEAFPIVSLIAFLVGAILAFVGVVQLNKFGAGIYVADLVAVGVVREMGAIMTGVIMAGRTGAAFAAQLGTMKVNEEIDALTTMGIDPIDFLVLPKIIALILMLPLLSIYANLLGVMGGAAVSLAVLDVSIYQYMVQTIYSVNLVDFIGGLFKAIIYGVLIAIAGCRCGIECGKSAAAVGLATTSAVVSGIVAIVVANAILNVIYTLLDI
ncbi:MAG: ABC transporter permease [Gammaproteobacteria bacterium]|nr:ABC transporter permease [Gammaproteobacteria bacterium]